MKEALSKIVGWATISSPAEGMATAQHDELQRQIPVLYAVLSINSIAVSYTHFQVAPLWMTLWLPLILIPLCLARLVIWVRRPRKKVDDATALKMLRRTTFLAAVISLAFVSWSLGFYNYGGDAEHAHVALFIATTVIGCIFCLVHLPQAALAVTIIVMAPYLYFQLIIGGPINVSVAFNILLVTLLLIRVLLNSFAGFEKLIEMQTESRRLNKEVTHLANTDILTGLPNRRMFFSEVNRLIESRETDSPIALGVIDLDRFKAANDAFGHFLGDQLLTAVSRRFLKLFDGKAMLARLGGDEFAFVLQGDAETAYSLARQACQEVSAPFNLGHVTISIGATCGIATTVEAKAEADTLYDCADYALYYAKTHSRGVTEIYSAEHEQTIRAEGAIEAALHSANLENELDIHFHPIVRIKDGHIVGAETLARWTSPEIGAVAPDQFIPIAERSGLIHSLSLVLLRKVLDALDTLPPDIKLSFNLSALDFATRDRVEAIKSQIEQSGVDARRLIIELTETAVLRDFQTAEKAINELRALGVQIALDDFGTGQSSLSYLHRLSIDHVKIDRSFIAGADDASGRELLAAVIMLCKSLHMKCIAEGVERDDQRDMLRIAGCDEYQGYLFCKPMPLEDFEMLLGGKDSAPQYASSS